MADAYFSPAFGNRPSQLVGRDHVLASILDGLDSRPGSKERASIILGQRGSGKTVLLWEIADRARNKGFVVASPTVVSEDMPVRIIEKIQSDGERHIKNRGGQLTGGTIGVLGFSVGLQFSPQIQESKSFGYKLHKLCERLEEQGRGMLILVDELQASSPELKQLVATYTELVGERRNVAIVFAGLPGAVSSMLNDRVLTFLNRAHKVTLDPLAIGDVYAFFAQAFAKLGISIDSDMRRQAAEATHGSPYLLQLVGHNIVQYAGEDKAVDRRVLADATTSAQTTFEQDVCATTLAALSDKDRAFLTAMAGDAAESRMADIASRMNVSADYAQKYRKRLIGSGIIAVPRRGYVAFAVPYLADHLKSDG